MALVQFKDLCIDTRDPSEASRFWARVLALTAEALDDGDAVLRGSTPEHTIWVNRVPEPRTAKARVHLDVHAWSVAEMEAAGARVLPEWGSLPWTVMADPEGGEVCAFVRPEDWWTERKDPYRLYEVAVDAADAPAIAAWWADVLGTDAADEDGVSAVAPPGAPFDAFVFATVPEPKTVKNRIHWDVTGGADAVDALVRRGARVLRAPDAVVSWTVMADPEGNEFCVFGDEALSEEP
ncbi:VOC family protein [Mumia sp. ZJ430]|uniref:VOC family protein n=1 Tax=Mumia sp. ZJ430 TaxID=2708083 RepID=UPI00141E6DC7|nr:VOC family protein [Mumia sp. ZJ430]